MASVGDVIRFIDYQSMANIEGDVLNVYYFKILATTIPNALSNLIEDIGNAWFTTYLADITPLQSSSIAHTRLQVDNMMDFAEDFAVYVPETALVGEAISPFSSATSAWSFQLVRQFRTTRNGSKRICGVPESQVDNNVPVVGLAGTIAAAETRLGSEWIMDWSDGESSTTFAPVIAKTPVAPATLPTVFNPVTAALFRGVGSQNSRKQLLS